MVRVRARQDQETNLPALLHVVTTNNLRRLRGSDFFPGETDHDVVI